MQLEDLQGSAVSSPSGVRAGDPTANAFLDTIQSPNNASCGIVVLSILDSCGAVGHRVDPSAPSGYAYAQCYDVGND